MAIDIRWHIGKEGAAVGQRLDRPPYRAYFYHVENNFLIEASDYAESELRNEIEARKERGEQVEPFVEALGQLSQANQCDG